MAAPLDKPYLNGTVARDFILGFVINQLYKIDIGVEAKTIFLFHKLMFKYFMNLRFGQNHIFKI